MKDDPPFYRKPRDQMSRTHHAVCAYRLSCDCIVEYNSFPPDGSRSILLCGSCGESSGILYRYPEDSISCHVTCRAARPEGGNVRVRCSLGKRHEGKHYDQSVRIWFCLPRRLRSGREGNT